MGWWWMRGPHWQRARRSATQQRKWPAESFSHGETVGGDRGYDTRGFVAQMREAQQTPDVAQNTSGRRRAIDGRTARHEGYVMSQRKRRRVEEVFGWMRTIALQRKIRFRGPERVGRMFAFAAAAYHLVRMRNLQAATA